VTNNII